MLSRFLHQNKQFRSNRLFLLTRSGFSLKKVNQMQFILYVRLSRKHYCCVPIRLLILCPKSMYSFCEEKVHTFEYVAE